MKLIGHNDLVKLNAAKRHLKLIGSGQSKIAYLDVVFSQSRAQLAAKATRWRYAAGT
jgi:hypothetical protein